MSTANSEDRGGWFCICVDSLTDGIARGTVQSQFQPEPVAFYGLDHVIQIGEEIMNDKNLPQAFFRIRQFEKQKKGSRGDSLPHHIRSLPGEEACQPAVVQRGKWATFNIQVLCRRNASWQGRATLYYNKKASTLHFRSVLELTLAMREVLAVISSMSAFTSCDEADDCCAAVQII